MTQAASDVSTLRFDFTAAGCLRLSDTTVVIHLRGAWRASESADVGRPDLVIRTSQRQSRVEPVQLPGSKQAVATPRGETWAGIYAVPTSLLRRTTAPELALETEDAAFVLPGGDAAWDRWAASLAAGERPEPVSAPAAEAPPAPAPAAPAASTPRSAARREDPLLGFGIGLVVLAATLTALPILVARPEFAPVFVAVGALVAVVVRQPLWMVPSFAGLTWAAIPGSFYGGLPSPVESLGLILLGFALWRALRRLDLAREVLLVCSLLALPVIASWALSAPDADPPTGAMKELIFLPIVAFGLARIGDVEKTVRVLVIVGAILGAGALFSVLVTGTALFPLQIDEYGVEADRAAGPFGESNFFALSLAVLVPIALYVTAHGGLWRLIGPGAVVVIFGGIVATGSRGGLVAAVAGLLAVGVAAGNLGGNARAMRYAVVAAVIGVAILLPALAAQLQSSAERTVSGRATENIVALAMFADRPLTGVGPQRYPALYRDYTRRIGDDDRVEREAHSLPLQIAAEQGMAGIVGWIAAGAVFLRFVAATGTWRVPVGRALLLSIGVYLVGSLFLHGSNIRLFYLLIGAVFALGAAAVTTRRAGEAAA